ncbi:MAG: hypothetical protein WD249_13670 [Gaiellaceae bacterium]
MDRAKWDRWAPGAGILGVALIIVTFFLPAKSPPKVGDEAAMVAAFFTDNRSELLTSAFLSGLAIIALTWFFASLVYSLWNAGEVRLSIVVLAGAVMLGAMATLATALEALLAYDLAGRLEAETVRGVFLLTMAPYAFGWGLAIIALATGVAAMRSAMLPAWYSGLSVLAALWFVVSGLTYADSGFFSPSGGFGFIGFLAFLAWVLLTSGLLLRRSMPGEAPTAAPASM